MKQSAHCSKKYVAQTCISFSLRFKEHFQSFKCGNDECKFTQHIENRHTLAPINEIMDALCMMKKGRHMNTLTEISVFGNCKW